MSTINVIQTSTKFNKRISKRTVTRMSILAQRLSTAREPCLCNISWI